MKKFLFSIFIIILIIEVLVFSFNYFIDPIGISGNQTKFNKTLFLETKNSNREKFLAPPLFHNTNFDSIYLGTSKGKFVDSDQKVGNFSVPNLEITDYKNYFNYIQSNNIKKIKTIYIFMDVEQLFSKDNRRIDFNELTKFKLIKKYFSFEYFKESLYQFQMNLVGREGLNIYRKKQYIWSKKSYF